MSNEELKSEQDNSGSMTPEDTYLALKYAMPMEVVETSFGPLLFRRELPVGRIYRFSDGEIKENNSPQA